MVVICWRWMEHVFKTTGIQISLQQRDSWISFSLSWRFFFFFTLKFGEDLIFNLWVSYDFQLAKNNCPPTEKTKKSQQYLRGAKSLMSSGSWHQCQLRLTWKKAKTRGFEVYGSIWCVKIFQYRPNLKKSNPLRILGPHLLTGGMKSHWDPGSLQVTIPMNRLANTDIATFLGKHCFARSKISTPFLITCGK